jgi:hypothetical protein
MKYAILALGLLISPALAEPTAAPIGDAVFPSAVDPKYAQEEPVKAAMHTCVDQYNNNKSTNANGGLKWIQRGGGYYSQCLKRLPGTSSGPAPVQDRGEKSERYTPEKYDRDDCDQIEYIFDACSASEKPAPCYMVHRAGAGESKSLGAFFDEHPNLDLGAACDQVCYGKMTVLQATRKFCPSYQP